MDLNGGERVRAPRTCEIMKAPAPTLLRRKVLQSVSHMMLMRMWPRARKCDGFMGAYLPPIPLSCLSVWSLIMGKVLKTFPCGRYSP